MEGERPKSRPKNKLENVADDAREMLGVQKRKPFATKRGWIEGQNRGDRAYLRISVL